MNNQSFKILIVDDTKLNRDLIKAIIKPFGLINITEAEDGNVAINKVEKTDYDLIFMDIQMPVMDGIIATKYIRTSLKRKTPIIAITAYNWIEIEENGFNDLILKPYNIDKIKSVIKQYLGLDI